MSIEAAVALVVLSWLMGTTFGWALAIWNSKNHRCSRQEPLLPQYTWQTSESAPSKSTRKRKTNKSRRSQ